MLADYQPILHQMLGKCAVQNKVSMDPASNLQQQTRHNCKSFIR